MTQQLQRLAEKRLAAMGAEQWVVAVTGPRQSGKTTLVRRTFPKHLYRNLEDPETREWAERDPKSFLLGDAPLILDEVQRVPSLLSHLQVIVDEQRQTGRFVLTGSQSFTLSAAIAQSLAGRVTLLTLLPFSYPELDGGGCAKSTLDEVLFAGGYPPIYDRNIEPRHWLNDYIATYLERDVRQLVQVRELATFQRFLALTAGWVGGLLNLSTLAADAGISLNTAKHWLSVLETSGLVFRVLPHHNNFRKRLVKSPKLYWVDSGLCCRLLGIQDPQHLSTHPARGALFESWVISELMKGRLNRGERPNAFFWRDHLGTEVDVVIDHGGTLLPIEIKSGSTIASDWFSGLTKWSALAGAVAEQSTLVYGGQESLERQGTRILSWRQLGLLTHQV